LYLINTEDKSKLALYAATIGLHLSYKHIILYTDHAYYMPLSYNYNRCIVDII